MGSRYAGEEECLGRLAEATSDAQRRYRLRRRDMCAQEVAMEDRVERRAAMKRSVAQPEIANGEIELVGRAPPPPAERHSKFLARCPQ